MSKNGEVKAGRKILFTTGGNGSTNCRISIPKSWIDEMGVTKTDYIKVSFIDGKIIIEKQ